MVEFRGSRPISHGGQGTSIWLPPVGSSLPGEEVWACEVDRKRSDRPANARPYTGAGEPHPPARPDPAFSIDDPGWWAAFRKNAHPPGLSRLRRQQRAQLAGKRGLAARIPQGKAGFVVRSVANRGTGWGEATVPCAADDFTGLNPWDLRRQLGAGSSGIQ